MTEAALQRKSEERRVLLDTIPVQIWYLTDSETYGALNRAHAEFLGFPPKSLAYKKLGEIPAPDVAALFTAGNIEVFQTKKTVHTEQWIPNAAGEQRLIAITRTPKLNLKGDVEFVVCAGVDITELRRSEQALEEKEKQLELFFNQSLDGFFFMMHDEPIRWEETVDKEKVLDHVFSHQRVTKVNDAMLAQYGATREEFARLTPSDFFAHDIPYGRQVYRKLFDDGRLHVDAEERKLDGSVMWIEGDYICFYDSQGRIKGHFGIQRDATERKRAEIERLEVERRILLSQKRESLGAMAGAVAHHFNNLLGTVMGNLDLVLDDLPGESGPSERISEAMKAARRAADLSRLMLIYVGQEVHHKTLCDLSREVERMMSLIEASLPGKVSLEKAIEPNLPVIRANVDAIRQVAVKLAANSWEALGASGGKVRIATGAVRCDAAYLKEAVVGTEPLPSGDYVFLEVSDDGCGMDAETVTRMFDPFFSTKFPGRGLGLPAVLGIARSHHGGVVVSSEPGRGTSVRLLLPAAGKPKPSEEPEATPKKTDWCSGGTVLLAEDDEMVRKVAKTMLERIGFAVLDAPDGAQAVELFQAHSEKIACVICDMTMPRLNGWETLRAIRRLKPGTPVILASGYDETQVMASAQVERPQAFLHKPYQMADLKGVLEQIVKEL